MLAWLPCLLLVVFVLAWGEPGIKKAIDTWTNGIQPSWFRINSGTLNGLNVPGLHNQNALGLNPILMASVNSAAGVMGKMISVQRALRLLWPRPG
jgi:L-lactate permease